eukprot:495642_1
MSVHHSTTNSYLVISTNNTISIVVLHQSDPSVNQHNLRRFRPNQSTYKNICDKSMIPHIPIIPSLGNNNRIETITPNTSSSSLMSRYQIHYVVLPAKKNEIRNIRQHPTIV